MLQEIEPVKNRWDFLIVAALEEEIQAFESVLARAGTLAFWHRRKGSEP